MSKKFSRALKSF